MREMKRGLVATVACLAGLILLVASFVLWDAGLRMVAYLTFATGMVALTKGALHA